MVQPDDYKNIVVSGGTANSVNVTMLTTGTPYQVRVRAHNEDGFGSAKISTPSYLSPKTTPGAPHNATIFAMSDTQLKVVWQTP